MRSLWFSRDGSAITAEEWVRRRSADPNYVRVFETIVGKRRVSTVFLGLDHGFGVGRPIIFETMTFPDQSICERYATEEEALAGHAKIVAQVQAEEDAR